MTGDLWRDNSSADEARAMRQDDQKPQTSPTVDHSQIVPLWAVQRNPDQYRRRVRARKRRQLLALLLATFLAAFVVTGAVIIIIKAIHFLG